MVLAMYFHTLVFDKFAFRCAKDLETKLNVCLVLLLWIKNGKTLTDLFITENRGDIMESKCYFYIG